MGRSQASKRGVQVIAQGVLAHLTTMKYFPPLAHDLGLHHLLPMPPSCFTPNTGSPVPAWLSEGERTVPWATPSTVTTRIMGTAKVGHFPGGGAENLENIPDSCVCEGASGQEGKAAKQSCSRNNCVDDPTDISHRQLPP